MYRVDEQGKVNSCWNRLERLLTSYGTRLKTYLNGRACEKELVVFGPGLGLFGGTFLASAIVSAFMDKEFDLGNIATDNLILGGKQDFFLDHLS